VKERGTTERVLSLLWLLQQRQVWTGPELAARLGVTPRTVRRDVERLRTLGYPVHAGQVSVTATSSALGRTCRRCSSTTRRRSPRRSRCWRARAARSQAQARPRSGR
jgi:DeoR/GlpR family transcriptional regulator of sugar metabolism